MTSARAVVLESLPVAYLCLAAALLALGLGSIPPRYPVHWTDLGVADEVARRSVAAFAPVAAGVPAVLALLALRRRILRRARERARGLRAAADAALGAAYALAAVAGALSGRPFLGTPGPWAGTASASMAFLFAPVLVVFEGRAGWGRRMPAPPRVGAAEPRRLALVVLSCGVLGAALAAAWLRRL
ncbi:MAG TPA: hypothetical protein VMT17_20375 [Anaeromyxobacteraceae bacterium]|nr:hypothetical protein [Anaeromyxobacteraceae bacterium]